MNPVDVMHYLWTGILFFGIGWSLAETWMSDVL